MARERRRQEAEVVPDPVELLRELLRFDSSNPPGNERPLLEFVADLFERGGLESRFLSRDPERPNLIAHLPGRGEAEPLLLFGHVDVVPARAEEWRQPPFAGELVDGEVWGRGALDMKAGVTCLVVALLRLASSGSAPPGDLLLALTSDEEQGSGFGARFLVDDHPELFEGVRYAIGEAGGFTTWIAGRPFYPIQVTEKQACTVRAAVRGEPGHPAMPSGKTAASRLAALLAALERPGLPVHVTPIAREMLTSIAADLPAAYQLALPLLLAPALTNPTLRLLGAEGRAVAPLLHNTAVATAIHGGDGGNVIPSELTVELDCRLLPGQTTAGLLSELDTLAAGSASFELIHEEPATPVSPDLRLLPLLGRMIRAHDPAGIPVPMLSPGYTDARHFARLGIQSYGFLPLKLPRRFPTNLVHAPDERVPAEAVRFGVDCLTDLLQHNIG